MGKFDHVLIASDFDDTICFTSAAKGHLPPVSPENRAAMEYFMAEGGTFSVSTGRSLPSYLRVLGSIDLPMNGPSIIFNGAAIYDCPGETYLHTAFLPEDTLGYLQQTADRFPHVPLLINHADSTVHCLHYDAAVAQKLGFRDALIGVDSLAEASRPISKCVFVSPDAGALQAVADDIAAHSWSRHFQVMTSTPVLLEVTAKDATKGAMVKRLAELLGIAPRDIYCVGDQANDVSMLECAHIPFAPANAIDVVHQVSGIHILPHCRDHAIAALIAELDSIY